MTLSKERCLILNENTDNDQIIRTTGFYVYQPLWKHIYVTPFIFIYLIGILCYFLAYDYIFGGEEWTFLFTVGILTINGGLFLAAQWSIECQAWLTCKKVNAVTKAEYFKVIPQNGKGSLCKIHVFSQNASSTSKYSDYYFYYHHEKYTWDQDRKVFRKLRYPINMPASEFRATFNTLKSSQDILNVTQHYGLNRCDIPLPAFIELFKEHAVAPFFVFQVFCVGLWLLDEYWYYSLFTLAMLVVFESSVVFQQIKSMQELRGMAMKPFDIVVKRQDRWTTIKSDLLIPGDICVIDVSSDDTAVPCDVIILEGSCVVNEAMLTGESTPLIKESIEIRKDDDMLDVSNVQDKVHILWGGTKILQSTAPQNSTAGDLKEVKGCVCFVMRTGFATSQGKLIRTMVHSEERVTANNAESFLFIGFLLIFAIIASTYVWIEGSKNKERKRSKLILDCIIIITSVVPPELPMELSLAVNQSLLALSKLAIFCVEPFRIPMAGKVDICCFDKTGTLTSENLVIEGFAGLDSSDPQKLVPPHEVDEKTKNALATCHSLCVLDNGKLIGDPMELTVLQSIKWTMDKDAKIHPINFELKRHCFIVARFPFSSTLKRMTTIAQLVDSNKSTNSKYMVAIKGAPEVLKSMYRNVPEWYDSTYKSLTIQGKRVLSVGWKEYTGKQITAKSKSELRREDFENDHNFLGFLVFHCPLKADTKAALRMLHRSSHRVTMITGDNALTACHIASEVDIITKEALILDSYDNQSLENMKDLTSKKKSHETSLEWRNPYETIRKHYVSNKEQQNTESVLSNYELKHDLCLTGKALSIIQEDCHNCDWLLPRVKVWARTSPNQKEWILTELKRLGYTTLMCGDGTNDVGALKQAHVGVALLDGNPEDLAKIAQKAAQDRQKLMEKKQVEMRQWQENLAKRWNVQIPPAPESIQKLQDKHRKQLPNSTVNQKEKKLQDMANNLMADMDDAVPRIKFGDASVAAPFTSKLSSIMSICNVIRQGRCTLVTTMQMYKILALNCLISAYALSVLYLDGIKNGDIQATVQGFLIAACFLFLSRAKPLADLSKERPQPNILNLYILLSVLGQFAIHIASLLMLTTYAKTFDEERIIDLDGDFSPNLLNTVVYLISLNMQVSTFMINYQGQPFRESLRENRPLWNSLCGVGTFGFVCALELIPELNKSVDLVEIPFDMKKCLVITMVADFAGAWLIEILSKWAFSTSKPKKIFQD